jgi:hypothetical protein
VRLQLIGRRVIAPALVLAAAWAPVRVGAQEPAAVKADVRSAAYQDDDRTLILTSTVAAEASHGPVTVGARYLVDAISSASVDVTSAATERFTENRHEMEGSATLGGAGRTASASYIFSTENDWRSHSVNLGGSQDFLQHNLTVAAGYTGVWNQVSRAGDPYFQRQLDVHAGGLTLTVTPSSVSLVQLNGTLMLARGYQASPYRYVHVGGAGGTGFAETHPKRRTRAALAARYHRHVFADSALQTLARYYQDDWGVRSLTAGVEWLAGFGELTVGLRARGYGQTGARFYRERYDQPLRYMSADRELSTFVDLFAGPHLTWVHKRDGTPSEIRVELKADGFGFWFFDFAPLPTRYGGVVELALGVSL